MLFGAIFRNIIRNINVQNEEGGSKSVWTMLQKNRWFGPGGRPLLYEFSFCLWQGMVGLNLKNVIHKNSRTEKKIGQNFSVPSNVYFVFWSCGPFLRIMSKNAGMRFGLKQNMRIYSQKFRTTQDTSWISMLSSVNNICYQRFLPWVEFNVWGEHKMRGDSLSCYIPCKDRGVRKIDDRWRLS